MEQQKIIALLKSVIKTRREEVVKALKDATVVLPYNYTDEDLLQTILKELKNDNGYLVYHLGKVIDNFFDATTEKKSNWVAAAIGAGASLLGKFMGSGGDDGKAMAQAQLQAAQAEAARQAATDISSILLLQQQQQAAQAARDEQRRREEAASRATTMWVVGGIVGFLVIGGIITAIIVSGNKAKAAA